MDLVKVFDGDLPKLHRTLCSLQVHSVSRVLADVLDRYPERYPNWMVSSVLLYSEDVAIVLDKTRPRNLWMLRRDDPGNLNPWKTHLGFTVSKNVVIPLTPPLMLAAGFGCVPADQLHATVEQLLLLLVSTEDALALRFVLKGLRQITYERQRKILQLVSVCPPERLLKLHRNDVAIRHDAEGLIRNLSGSRKDFKMARRICVARKLRMLK